MNTPIKDFLRDKVDAQRTRSTTRRILIKVCPVVSHIQITGFRDRNRTLTMDCLQFPWGPSNRASCRTLPADNAGTLTTARLNGRQFGLNQQVGS